MKVLIVEDDILIAMHLEELVVGLGHRVCAVAPSAPVAIERAAEHAPDVALMDIRLARGTSGIDAAREIHLRFGLRCIFLSGNLEDAARHELAPYEPVAFLGKPILPYRLSHALAEFERELNERSR